VTILGEYIYIVPAIIALLIAAILEGLAPL